jgi:hypothetical protein
MARFRYFFSRDPSAVSPTTDELLSIEAESRPDALDAIIHRNGAPEDWPSLFVNLLVWTSDDGEQRGFESTRLR